MSSSKHMKTSSVRIAAIYWPITSVGGIHSELHYYQTEARRVGDRFDVIRSFNIPSLGAGMFPTVKRMRGGDTFIDLDGYAGHHPSRVAESLKFLRANYDALFFVSLVPHPNKQYGFEPQFLPLFTETRLPKVASISDGYWVSYAEWGRLVIPTLKKLYTGCEAYAIPLRNEGIQITVRPRPFVSDPAALVIPRSPKMLTVWTHQWKDIKGIIPFLKVVPKIPGDIELYSTGIRYFQYRGTEIWKHAICHDYFQGFHGQGKAEYYGWVPLEKMPAIYRRAWFAVGLQGITARKQNISLFGGPVSDPRMIYSGGSYNNAETEALYYGSVPVLHEQVLKSDLPKDCILTVKRAEELPALIGSKEARDFVLDPRREKRAREWVSSYHDPVRIYSEMKEALFS